MNKCSYYAEYKSVPDNKCISPKQLLMCIGDSQSNHNITIQIPSPIDKTDINGLSINNLTIQKPIRFSILWGAKNTLQKQLGFLNNKQGLRFLI